MWKKTYQRTVLSTPHQTIETTTCVIECLAVEQSGRNLTQPCMTDDLTRVTAEPFYATTQSSVLYNLAAGVRLSDCKLPCTTLKTLTSYNGRQVGRTRCSSKEHL